MQRYLGPDMAMQFHADHHFRIGRAHLTAGMPCQDYALSGTESEGGYAIVTDGCSSGGKTDVGARLIAHAMLAKLRCEPALPLDQLRRSLMLEPEDMLATCAWADCSPAGGIVRLVGDGAFALLKRNGDLHVEQASWADNTPFYPTYCGEQLTRFVEFHRDNRHCLRLDIWDVCGEAKTHRAQTMDVETAMRGVERRFGRTELDDLACIAVFSDGIAQVDGMPWLDAVRNLLAFKTTTGRFAVRRLNRFIQEVSRESRGPLDDTAMAAIRIEPDEGGAPWPEQ